MIIIVCVDDHMGVMFHDRRQSADRVLREHILANLRGRKLWMDSYSSRQFSDAPDRISVSGDFLSAAGSGDYCFLEGQDVSPYMDRVEEVVLYRWNRTYPADQYFNVALLEGWTLDTTEEFEGYSHKKITKEVYVK